MDAKPEVYAASSDGDVLDLILRVPLAWMVSSDDVFGATLLPLRPQLDDAGRLVALMGHFARSNPQVRRLRDHPRALVLFTGPQAYVSPSWMADRTQAPTWNYASAAFDCDLEWFDGPEQIEAIVQDLVEAQEQSRPGAWSAEEMGARYAGLARGIIAFRAEIRTTRAVFKLGQDERRDVFDDILMGLDANAGGEISGLMRRFAARADVEV